MNKMMVLCTGALLTAGILLGCTQPKADEGQHMNTLNAGYTMPDESSKHEGTWLIWPHNFTYGKGHKEALEPIWIEMTSALSEGERVHIIAYDKYEQNDIEDLLYDEGINMDKIDFYIAPTDDVWARDTAPIFVYDKDNHLKLMDWGFNGWGKKVPYKKDAALTDKLSKQLDIERINLSDVVLEGGAFELDGKGTFLSTRSAVTNKNRNPKHSEAEIEKVIAENLGVTKFIWLDGVSGQDITDFHIDGIAKFYNESTLITMNEEDLQELGASDKDIHTLMNATNAFDEPYQIVHLPMSKNNVVLDNGTNLGYKGSYINFYIGNAVVLVPNYYDPNDKIANDAIQRLYPDRKVIGIDVRELYKDGGMIHCVTQQQPIALK